MTSLTLGVILDRSGSMTTIWEESLGSLNKMVGEQADEGKTVVPVTVFDDEIESFNPVVAGVGKVVPDEVKPRGLTALHDAVYKGIKNIEEAARGTDKTAVIIVTDGGENASQDHDLASVQGIIKEKTDEGWEFFFVGANQDAWGTSRTLGTQNAMNWTPTAEGTQMVYDSLNTQLSTYRNND